MLEENSLDHIEGFYSNVSNNKNDSLVNKKLLQNSNFKNTQILMNSIDEYDNPVVVLLKLKNNL